MKLFGTDGIRGRANEFPITAEVALRMGKAVANVLRSSGPNLGEEPEAPPLPPRQIGKAHRIDDARGRYIEYPTQLANIPVASKPPLDGLPKLNKLMQKASAAFGENGRHMIRYSGTENMIRVLVEHCESEECRHWVGKFATVIREEIG